jgi:hypothetical protein
MKKTVRCLWCLLIFPVFAETVIAADLNEWTFEKDDAGRTLSQAINSGTDSAVFSGGGTGSLETDGIHSLLCTHTGGDTNDMWINGAVLDADVAHVSSSVQFFRYDFEYDLRDWNPASGTVLGLFVTDSSGTNVAGVAAVRGSESAPAGMSVTSVATNLDSGTLSVIVKVDMDAQIMDVWYNSDGSGSFDENNPAVTNIPIHLTSIDKLRFQATGEFRPDGSPDYVAVNNIRTASTWEDIAAPVATPVIAVHSLFRTHLILQRDMNVPVWGHATPGSTVTVKLDGTVVGTVVADSEGKWLAGIGTHAADGAVSHVLSIEPSDTRNITIEDVIFGDVYLASGQSNMARLMSQFAVCAEEAPSADYPLIRQIAIRATSSDSIQEEPQYTSYWTKCSPSTVSNFSATGYFFAKNVYLQTGVPVGLLFSAWGGQQIDRFLSPSGVAAVPELAGLRQAQEEGSISSLYDIYNAMIAPLIPYGIRGAVWYQGEANSGDRDLYIYKMQALMRGWRQDWGQGDFFLYYAQLPNYGTTDVSWRDLRDAQRLVLSQTNCGMAVTIDIGNDADIHPENKPDVGYRLSRWALAKDLGWDIVYSGPIYHSTQVEGSALRVLFDYADDGLMIGKKDGTNEVVSVPAGTLENFEIAGDNKQFTNAEAWIDADTVVVSNAAVPNPVYVRYCFTNAPSGPNKLYNAAGLPASPFHTDQYHILRVQSGSGTSMRYAGDQWTITASTPPSGQVFDRWIGAASELGDLNASATTLTMPAHALSLLAAYRDVSATDYTLTVNNGFGSGASKSGSILNIAADSPSVGQLFDYWTGDTQEVADVYAAATTLRMPTNDVTVTAVYRTVDSVGDGIADIWRALYFGGDGTITNSQSSADADPDGDGMRNFQEYGAGTSPVDARSVLQLGESVSDGAVALNFQSVAGYRYRLETTGTLTYPDWQPVLYNIAGDGMQKQIGLSVGMGSSGFYRLRLMYE